MVSVSTSLSLVSSSATWSSLITDFHSRGARPAQRTRTPSSCISSRRRRITSRLKPIRKRTSSGERDQFSVEKAYAEIAFTPISIAPSTTSNSECSPCSCPAVRGSPRSLAQRPLPSITIATCRGTRSRGTAGGRAPDGCGVGGRTCATGHESSLVRPTCRPMLCSPRAGTAGRVDHGRRCRVSHSTRTRSSSSSFTLLPPHVRRIHVRTSSRRRTARAVDLRRSCACSPTRGRSVSGSIAATFRLDPSTITRQVQTRRVRLGLAEQDDRPDRPARRDAAPHRRRARLPNAARVRAALATRARRLDRRASAERVPAAYLTRFNGAIRAWLDGLVATGRGRGQRST